MKLFIYGSLMSDMPAHHLLEGLEFEETGMVLASNQALADTGNGWPGVVHIEETPLTLPIYGEVYNVPRSVLTRVINRLDSYEGVPHLFRRTEGVVYYLETAGIPHAGCYYYGYVPRIDQTNGLLLKGDWRDYQRNGGELITDITDVDSLTRVADSLLSLQTTISGTSEENKPTALLDSIDYYVDDLSDFINYMRETRHREEQREPQPRPGPDFRGMRERATRPGPDFRGTRERARGIARQAHEVRHNPMPPQEVRANVDWAGIIGNEEDG